MSAASATASASHFLFKGLRLFKWNEKLSKNNVPDDQGLFLFTVHNNKNSSKKMNVVAFDSNELIYRWPMSCSSTVLGALQDTRFVKSSSDAESLSDEIAEYMSICLFLTMDSVFLPACSSPCLVFAVDLLEVEGVDGRLHPGTDHPNLITASLSMSLIDVGTCTSRDQIVVALVSRKVLHVAFSREVADVPEDPMCLDDIDYPSDLDDEESDHVDSAMDDDAVEEEKEEFAEVAGVLRS